MATFLPLGFLTGYVASWVMKKLNILRVPPEVELMGLDVAEYEPNLYLPEVAVATRADRRARRDDGGCRDGPENRERRGGGLDAVADRQRA